MYTDILRNMKLNHNLINSLKSEFRKNLESTVDYSKQYE